MERSIELSRPDGQSITAWDDWTRPKMTYHWAPGRSAMELAKAWFRESEITPPEELVHLLRSSNRLDGLQFLRGIPEFETSLPESGGGRNHDLWLTGKTSSESVTICIEAKADEPFDNKTVAGYRASTMALRETGKSTRVPERIDKLLALMPGTRSRWDGIRYQLLTALCGTAIQAERDGSDFAVFVVHEFHTTLTTVKKTDLNAKDYDAFLNTIDIPPRQRSPGMLYGPVKVSGIDCYLGKAIIDMKGNRQGIETP